MTGQHMYQQQLKSSLPVGPNVNLRQVWQDVCQRVARMAQNILKNPDDWIPVVNFSDIASGTVSKFTIDRIKVAGVCKIRGTIPKHTVEAWNNNVMAEIHQYFGTDESIESYDNNMYSLPENIAPKFGGVQQIFYSKSQFEARHHPNMIKTKVWLNKTLWKYMDGDEFIFVPDQAT